MSEEPKERTKNTMQNIDQLILRHRDAYINFKELANRCTIDIKLAGNNNSFLLFLYIDKEGHNVFYFKPDNPLLDDPEKQKHYRNAILKRCSTAPQGDPLTLMADDLHKVRDLNCHSDVGRRAKHPGPLKPCSGPR